ncbi:hypothetical protein GEV33_009621 [Tenebrio molitor]|uniref:Uncharacterized protein n=1 Tax=Tenebrio molitor TaxID=7067 RepID=A0A8J6HEF8_TENMO|nr:hypothetical protein GEV33_009621 [Tenebrio molitor]
MVQRLHRFVHGPVPLGISYHHGPVNYIGGQAVATIDLLNEPSATITTCPSPEISPKNLRITKEYVILSINAKNTRNLDNVKKYVYPVDQRNDASTRIAFRSSGKMFENLFKTPMDVIKHLNDIISSQ